jgi:hypothetical protein
MGYVREINPNTFDPTTGDYDSHQTSPGYCLTFLRWANRDTFNYDGSGLGPRGASVDPIDVRTPLVVYNDAISINVSNNKKGLSPSATFTLKGGDIDYATAIAPGDFVLVNMLNWESDAEKIRDRAISLQPINRIGDGFKGVFKVQNVVEEIVTDENSGIKSVTYNITSAGFTEFNNVIYYNPAIVAAFAQEGTLLYQAKIMKEFVKTLKSRNDIDSVIKSLFKTLIGDPIKADVKEVQDYGNKQFKVPVSLGMLLDKPNIKYASDLYDYMVGIWKDSKDAGISNAEVKGFNPGFDRDNSDNFWSTGIPIQGNKKAEIASFNSNTAWSIINGFLNETLNEMYTTYRITPSGNVQPVVITRQKPFSSEHFEPTEKVKHTKYLKLPRWRINSHLCYSLQVARNESFRFNFVQVFTRSIPENSLKGIDQATQIAQENFVIDEDDIQRHGLKPFVKTANFDFPGTNKPNKRLRAKEWSELVADWVIGGHLKLSGTSKWVGIQEDISVGDNIEIDNVVYHIESIVHSLFILPSGKKKFRTSMNLSYGVDLRSSEDGPVYGNMEHTDAHTKNIEDYQNEKLRPGISDTQNIKGRVDGEEFSETKQRSFTPSSLRKNRKKNTP